MYLFPNSGFRKIPESGADFENGATMTVGEVAQLMNMNFRKVQEVVNLIDYIPASGPANGDYGPYLVLAQQAAVAQGKDLFIPYLNDGTIDVKTTVKWLPKPGKTEYPLVVINCSNWVWKGGSGTLQNGDNSGNVMLYIAGMRNARIVNLGFGIPGNAGVQNVVCCDLDTVDKNLLPLYPEGFNSTTHIQFIGGGCSLGDGVNNKGYRMGRISGQGGDISNIHFQTVTVYGWDGGSVGAGGLASLQAIRPSQKGVENCGRNALNIIYSNCLFAYIGWGYTSERGSVGVTQEQYGGPNDSGNGAQQWDTGTVFSHVLECITVTSPQSYTVHACRFEDCKRIVWLKPGVHKPVLMMTNCQVDGCFTNNDDGSGNLIYSQCPSSIIIQNPLWACDGILYGPNCIRMDSYSGEKATLEVVGGGILAGDQGFYSVEQKDGVDVAKVYVRGVARLRQLSSEGNRLQAYTHFPDAGLISGASGGSQGTDLSQYFVPFGDQIYLKNPRGNFIMETQGAQVMEWTPGRIYVKQDVNLQNGKNLELEGGRLILRTASGVRKRITINDDNTITVSNE